MSSKLETVRAMIMKAGREDTPIDEARACALMAARMIVRLDFTIEQPKTIHTEYDTDGSVDFPDAPDHIPDFDDATFVSVDPFILGVTKYGGMICEKCKKGIPRGVPYAYSRGAQRGDVIRATCVHCRSWFTERG